jgi:hypothetical protein
MNPNNTPEQPTRMLSENLQMCVCGRPLGDHHTAANYCPGPPDASCPTFRPAPSQPEPAVEGETRNLCKAEIRQFIHAGRMLTSRCKLTRGHDGSCSPEPTTPTAEAAGVAEAVDGEGGEFPHTREAILARYPDLALPKGDPRRKLAEIQYQVDGADRSFDPCSGEERTLEKIRYLISVIIATPTPPEAASSDSWAGWKALALRQVEELAAKDERFAAMEAAHNKAYNELKAASSGAGATSPAEDALVEAFETAKVR